ncbi:MarR family winged helix-turn-helix transcriptional regulator [Neolewinella antarctica]|uniref:DNA-binding MarR family transcriptional regulator n=1 Tax=Neolewinella antarctica TaxID=442734 RepID=A0ABX0XBN0_9BACT|nr:MarR family transcriptional regulator [Neolewinella antarctica]NJC26681.1 DNA-binding MarR family transcriptional regulator [Neolewinella antarctica]
MTNQPGQSGLVASGGNDIKKLRYHLLQSCSWLNNLSRNFLSPFGITPKQYNILSTLAARNPESMSIQDVRNSLADKMSDASRLIDRLDKKGLLEKFPSDFDRRSNRTRITDKGLKLLTTIAKSRLEVEAVISERLNSDEIIQLNGLLARLK